MDPKKQDSPIKSNADRFADYLDQRQAAYLVRTMQLEESKRRLKNQGLSNEEAQKAIDEAIKSNKDPTRLKASEVRGKQGALIQKATKAAVLPWLFFFAPILFVMFFVLTLVATISSRPDALGSFLNKECLDTALGNKEAALRCIKETSQQHVGNSMKNQGNTI